MIIELGTAIIANMVINNNNNKRYNHHLPNLLSFKAINKTIMMILIWILNQRDKYQLLIINRKNKRLYLFLPQSLSVLCAQKYTRVVWLDT